MRATRADLGLLFAIALVAGFAQFGAVAALNDVARYFGHVSRATTLRDAVGLSGSEIGVGMGVVRLASLLAMPLSASADRHGRVRVLRRALLAGLLATAAATLSPSYWFFVACFALARPLLTAVSTLVQVVVVETSTSAQRISRLIVMAAGAGVGSGLSAVLHSLIRGPNSFRWLFALALVPVVLVVPLVHRLSEPHAHRADELERRLGSVPHAVRACLGIVALVSFATGLITGPANGFAFVYAEGVLRMAPHVVALVVVLSGLAGLAGLGLSRWLSHAWGRRATVGFGLICLGLTSSVAYAGGRTSFVVGYMLGVAAAGLFAPAASALSTEIFERRVRATAAGWVALAGVLGATVGLGVFGWLSDVIRSTQLTSLRTSALWTFWPLMPSVLLLLRVPESRGVEID